MRESGFYAPGTEFRSDSPWNQYDLPEHDFDITVSQTLSKSTSVTTNNYNPYRDDEDGSITYDTSDTCWADEYHDNDHYTPIQLIALFKQHLTKHIPDPIVNMAEYRRYKHLISECEDWSEDETDYEGE